MKKTIYIFHKSYNGALYVGGDDNGKPIPDDVKVFNTKSDAEEYACGFECVVDRKTFEKSSSYFQYIKSMEIVIE